MQAPTASSYANKPEMDGRKPADIHAHTQVHFKNAHEVGNGRETQTETLAQFRCILLSLNLQIAVQQLTFRGQEHWTHYAEQTLKFDFRFR